MELLIVVVIILVITAVAVPSVINGLTQARLRSSATDLAGLFQRMRTMAAKDNTFYVAYCANINSTPNCKSIWVEKNKPADTTMDATEPVVNFDTGVTMTTTGAPAGLTVYGQTPTSGVQPGYDSRGMPCNPSPSPAATTCSQTSLASPTTVYYLTNSSGLGAAKWMAVTIASGGRVQVWSYDATSGWGVL